MLQVNPCYLNIRIYSWIQIIWQILKSRQELHCILNSVALHYNGIYADKPAIYQCDICFLYLKFPRVYNYQKYKSVSIYTTSFSIANNNFHFYNTHLGTILYLNMLSTSIRRRLWTKYSLTRKITASIACARKLSSTGSQR